MGTRPKKTVPISRNHSCLFIISCIFFLASFSSLHLCSVYDCLETSVRFPVYFAAFIYMPSPLLPSNEKMCCVVYNVYILLIDNTLFHRTSLSCFISYSWINSLRYCLRISRLWLIFILWALECFALFKTVRFTSAFSFFVLFLWIMQYVFEYIAKVVISDQIIPSICCFFMFVLKGIDKNTIVKIIRNKIMAKQVKSKKSQYYLLLHT